MCRAHYIRGLGECCVKGCLAKATNRYFSTHFIMFFALLLLLSLSLSFSTSLTYKHHRNYKSGLGYPLKEGLEQPYKVCMDHWNQLEAQRTNEDDKKKRKLKKNEKDKKKKKKEKDKKKRVKKRYVIYTRERESRREMYG